MSEPREMPLQWLRDRFGPPGEWPAGLVALTVDALCRCRVGGRGQVDVAVYANGDVSVMVLCVDLSQPARSRLSFAGSVRGVMWWEPVTRPVTVTVTNGSDVSGPLDIYTHERGRQCVANVDVAVRIACDPEIVGPGPETWWNGWSSRLPVLMTARELGGLPGWRIVTHDEASGDRDIRDSPIGR
jgi:hypothetical protein